MLRFVIAAIAFGPLVLAAETLPRVNASDDELLELSKILRKVDENKPQKGQITVDFQNQTNQGDMIDNAKNKLISRVDDALLEKPSYKNFLAFMNSFWREVGKAEPRVSPAEEKQKMNAFLDVVLMSKPMVEVYNFLEKKGHPYAANSTVWAAKIEQLWFEHYSRSRKVADSSAFEHVFFGEAKKREVLGLHNWVRFYMLEKNATENFDYKGFILTRGNVMGSLKFTWGETVKKSGSIMIGTSPDYDMAVYTLCFLFRRGLRKPCKVELDGCFINIVSYDVTLNDKVYIGTVYPTPGRKSKQCGRQ